MKKFALFLASVVACSASAGILAQAAESEKEEELFTFRGIDWYSTREDAEGILLPGAVIVDEKRWAGDEDIYRLSGTNYSHLTWADDRIEGGGRRKSYDNLTVAGYEPSDTVCNYLYQINENGTINRDMKTAQFYFGYYTFESSDFVDLQSVYDDLGQKLASIYGEGGHEEDDYFVKTTWLDSEENLIRLLASADYDYVTLGYIAGDADQRLDEMQEALDNEQAIIEESERLANASNTEGL